LLHQKKVPKGDKVKKGFTAAGLARTLCFDPAVVSVVLCSRRGCCSPIACAAAPQKQSKQKKRKEKEGRSQSGSKKRFKSSPPGLSILEHRCSQDGTLEFLVAHDGDTPNSWLDPESVCKCARNLVVGYAADNKQIAKMLTRVPALAEDSRIANFASSYAQESSGNSPAGVSSDVSGNEVRWCCCCCCSP